MPYTIADSFARLRSNLEITDIQASVVSTRQQTIRQTVANGLTVVDDFLTGSYARSTMISPLSEADIDIFVCLDASYFHRYNNANGGPAGLLNLARQTIRKTYTSTPDISRNGQAVTVRFSDFVVDVVIGFHRNGGGYIIANSVNNFWLSTDPKKHVEIFSQANKQHNGNLTSASALPPKAGAASWSGVATSSRLFTRACQLQQLEVVNGRRIDIAG